MGDWKPGRGNGMEQNMNRREIERKEAKSNQLILELPSIPRKK